MERTYTPATIRTRAYGNIEKIRQKIQITTEARRHSIAKYDARINVLEVGLREAEEDLELLRKEQAGTIVADPEDP